MPHFPIVDTHLHLWDPSYIDYPWLTEVPSISHTHLFQQFEEATTDVDIQQLVFVQCECDRSQYMKELEWVTQIANQTGKITGIVPWAPLEKGDAVIPELEILSQNKLVKGIRRIIQHERNDLEFCLRKDFIRGVQLLEKYNLSFDICIGHIHFENTLKFIQQCPNVRFILDHIGKPDIKHQLFDPWKKHISELSHHPNVVCKISGFVTEADFDHWTIDDLKPYFNHVLECFGIDRLVFGGDWPVVLLASSYKKWIDTLDQLTSGFSNDELLKLYSLNAKKTYQLPNA